MYDLLGLFSVLLFLLNYCTSASTYPSHGTVEPLCLGRQIVGEPRFCFQSWPSGPPCEKSSSYSGLLLGDLNGFTTVNVRYCAHADPAPIAKPLQLIAAGIFPCSDIKARSAFTLLALDQYNISTTLGKTSGHKYYSILARVTKPGFPADVPDRYRELMSVHRRFAHILNLRRSGTLYAQHSTDVHPGDQALACIACPRPGFNFNWDEVLPSER
jgi:hypothetical protein